MKLRGRCQFDVAAVPGVADLWVAFAASRFRHPAGFWGLACYWVPGKNGDGTPRTISPLCGSLLRHTLFGRICMWLRSPPTTPSSPCACAPRTLFPGRKRVDRRGVCRRRLRFGGLLCGSYVGRVDIHGGVELPFFLWDTLFLEQPHQEEFVLSNILAKLWTPTERHNPFPFERPRASDFSQGAHALRSPLIEALLVEATWGFLHLQTDSAPNHPL